jgi:hypothetical protein
MADITISLSNVRNIKKLYIEDLDLTFEVRKMGAGEELDLSDKLRRLNEIIEELSAIDFNKINITKPTKKDIKAMEALTEKADSLMNEINDIKRFELETYKRCFTDNNGGKDTDKLIDSLSDEDRAELFKQIFSPAKVLKKEDVAPEVTSEVSDATAEAKEEKK